MYRSESHYDTLVIGCDMAFLGMLSAHWVSGVLHLRAFESPPPHFLDLGASNAGNQIKVALVEEERQLQLFFFMKMKPWKTKLEQDLLS